MANLTVSIGEDTIHYDPNPPVIAPGDTVTFTLVDRRDDVTVDFGPNSPFTVKKLEISGPTQNSSGPMTVMPSASGSYPFDVYPTGGRDQPGTAAGELEVNAGRPPEEL